MDDPTTFDQAHITLVYVDAQGDSHAVGNGFVILDQGTDAICLTAAHNFEFIKKLQASRKPSNHPTLPTDFAIKGTEYVDTLGIHALYFADGQAAFCKVDQLNYQAGYDVAVFHIYFEKSEITPNSFKGKIDLDLAIPRVGEEVAVIGHLLKEEKLGNGHFNIGRNVQFLWGFVTAATPGVGRMSQHYSFETTIPIRAGLSGSPILRKPEKNGPMTACGIVSFDFSDEESFKNFCLAGSSHAAALWPSIALGFVGELEGEQRKFIKLQELVEKKLIKNFSADKIATRIVDAVDRSDVYYRDARSDPPEIHRLTIPLHPLGIDSI